MEPPIWISNGYANCYMKKLFKWLLILTAVLAVGVVVILFNPVLIKGPLERYLSDLSGYQISLDGALKIDTGRVIELTATNILISGQDRTADRDLLALGSLKLVLVTASLFEDILVIASLQVDGLQLNLATDAAGEGNLLINNDQPSVSDGDDDPVVFFKDIKISESTIRYRVDNKGTEHLLHIASFAQHQQSDGMLQISIDGNYNDRPVEFSGTLGPFVNLLAGHDVFFSFNGHFGTLNITGDGLIDDLMEPRRPRFNLDIQGPDIDEITAMARLDDLGSGVFSVRMTGNEVDGHYAAGINGNIGDISLTASATLSDLSQLDELDLTLALNGTSLGAMTRALGFENWPDKPFRLKGDIKRNGVILDISSLTLVIGGSELVLDALLSNFPSLDASRVKLSIRGDDVVPFRKILGVPGFATGPFEVYGMLDVLPDQMQLLELEIKNSLGDFILTGTLGSAPDYVGSKLYLHVDGANAHTLMSALGIDALPEAPFSLETRVETVKNGLIIEPGSLLTIGEERLEFNGYAGFNSGGVGTDIEARLTGRQPARLLQPLVDETVIPDLPYAMSGRIRVVEQGIELDKVKLVYAGIDLALAGLIRLDEQLMGTSLDLQLKGDDFSWLSNFPAVGDSLDFFVPGQSYQTTGRLTIENYGLRLSDINGRIGKTDFAFDGLISQQNGLAGSTVRFSIKGPDIQAHLVDQVVPYLPHGAFDTSGQITLSDDTLSIKDFKFETVNAHGEIDLELGWPLRRSIDAGFNVNIRGDDIRHILPSTDAFQPARAAYRIHLVGQKRGKLISLQHFDAEMGNLQVSLVGEADDDPTDENVDISFSVVSKDLSALGRLNGERLPAMALDIKADFKGNSQQFVFNDLTATLGESHIAGMLDVSLTGKKPIIKLTAKSNYIDIRPFVALTDSDAEADAATSGEHLIPAKPLPLAAMAAVDMTIRLDIVELKHQQDSIRNLALDVALQAGKLTVEQLSFDGPRGKLRSSFSIHPTGNNVAEVSMDLNAEEFILNLTGQAKDKLHQVPTLDIHIHANGQGGNWQQVAGSLNGSIYLGTRGGILEGVNLSILDTFILNQIFSLIMPKTDAKHDLVVTCAATVLKITDGLLETDPALVFSTNRISMTSKGRLDLKTEILNFNFNATPNKALQISADEFLNPYILVSGTLSEPVVGLDPAKVVLHGGAAIGTAGLSILAKGLLDRLSNTVSSCEKMLDQITKQ